MTIVNEKEVKKEVKKAMKLLQKAEMMVLKNPNTIAYVVKTQDGKMNTVKDINPGDTQFCSVLYCEYAGQFIYYCNGAKECSKLSARSAILSNSE